VQEFYDWWGENSSYIMAYAYATTGYYC
jgi:hypothetical protein